MLRWAGRLVESWKAGGGGMVLISWAQNLDQDKVPTEDEYMAEDCIINSFNFVILINLSNLFKDLLFQIVPQSDQGVELLKKCNCRAKLTNSDYKQDKRPNRALQLIYVALLSFFHI